MSKINRWLLPDGLEELLPEQAAAAEVLRRDLLDSYSSWGYQLVRPPMLDFLESLQIGTGRDLALQTFTVTDQLSGRLLGLRADITPQVARMDAHNIKSNDSVRLCYCAPVLHSTATHLDASRELDQIGAELFGSDSVKADIEIIELMLMTVERSGAFDTKGLVKLDLGNVEIFRSAAKFAGLDDDQEAELCDILQRKALPELKEFIAENIKSKDAANLIGSLPGLCGDAKILNRAEKLFAAVKDKKTSKALKDSLKELKQVKTFLEKTYPDIELYFDLSELRGYDYHTGLVFAVYKQGKSQAIAKGGRYDAIGESFGRARPATGFSSDLRQLLRLANPVVKNTKAIFAPSASGEEASALRVQVSKLRKKGEVVIQALSARDKAKKQESCNRELVLENGSWRVKKIQD